MTPQKSIPAAYSDEWLAWMYKEGTVGHHHAMRLRDELAAAKGRIAELEQAVGWVPVRTGVVFGLGDGRIWAHGDRHGVGDDRLTIDAPFCHVVLPDYVRLCRRQVQEGAEG